MKHEYVGDHKDYYKYSLLRQLAEGGVKVNVCWMLTKEEDNRKRRDVGYLELSDEWESYDKKVFGLLKRLVDNGRRNVGEIEQSPLIPGAFFFTEDFKGSKNQRKRYFSEFDEQMPPVANSKESHLVFFDPDKGFRPRPKTLTDKHVYIDEISESYNKGYSLLLIQFPSYSEEIQAFAERRIGEIADGLGDHVRHLACCLRCEVIKGGSILYFLISQREQLPKMSDLVDRFVEQWDGRIRMPIRFQDP